MCEDLWGLGAVLVQTFADYDSTSDFRLLTSDVSIVDTVSFL